MYYIRVSGQVFERRSRISRLDRCPSKAVLHCCTRYGHRLHEVGVALAVTMATTYCPCPLIRCAINTTPDQVSTVSNAMDGFIDALPGGATDTMDFMMVYLVS